MTLKQAYSTLTVYQVWRMGADIPMQDPVQITEAINTILQDRLKQQLQDMKQETLEEAAKEYIIKKYQKGTYLGKLFIAGAKWQEERMIDFANWCRIHDKKFPNEVWTIQQLHTKYFTETYGSKGSETKQ